MLLMITAVAIITKKRSRCSETPCSKAFQRNNKTNCIHIIIIHTDLFSEKKKAAGMGNRFFASKKNLKKTVPRPLSRVEMTCKTVLSPGTHHNRQS
jgi:hypothetical protein